MKLVKIWSKLGKQPLYITQHTDAKVFIENREYFITGIRYEGGRIVGLNAVPAKEESIIDILNVIKNRYPEQTIVVESPDGVVEMKMGDAMIYEGMNGEIVIDSE